MLVANRWLAGVLQAKELKEFTTKRPGRLRKKMLPKAAKEKTVK